MMQDDAVVAQVREAVDAYETALMANDLAALDDFFHVSPLTIRYGVAENLYGFDEIAAFRLGRSGGSPARERLRTEIVAIGPDAAVANVEFTRTGTGRNGRQTQTGFARPRAGRSSPPTCRCARIRPINAGDPGDVAGCDGSPYRRSTDLRTPS